MRIPNEALPLYRRENESKTPADAEEKNAKPVSGAARIRSALSNLLPGQQQTAREDDLDEGDPGQNSSRRGNRDQPDNPERRHEERRKANQPTLLDTRATRSRRKSARTPTINFKI
jgi:hypothetical protein